LLFYPSLMTYILTQKKNKQGYQGKVMVC
jgi:hypothetical protein